MNNIKTTLLTVLFTIGFILPSCKKDFSGLCGDVASFRYFDIKGLDVFAYQDDVDGFEIFDSVDTISFSENVGIFMQYQADYHAAILPAMGLMNSAVACSVIGGYDGSKTEKLEDISIITLNDFDKDHLANSSIGDLLEVDLDGINEDTLPLMDYLANQTENIKKQALKIRLKKAPELNQEFLFKIEVELSTGERYEAENIPIYFRK